MPRDIVRRANSTLTDRIDLVLFRGALAVADVSLVGNQQTDRTPSGLWPSDHAGVLAKRRATSERLAPGCPASSTMRRLSDKIENTLHST